MDVSKPFTQEKPGASVCLWAAGGPTTVAAFTSLDLEEAFGQPWASAASILSRSQGPALIGFSLTLGSYEFNSVVFLDIACLFESDRGRGMTGPFLLA